MPAITPLRAAAAALAAAAVASVLCVVPSSPARAAVTTLSGVNGSGGPNGVAAFGAWRGRSVSAVNAFMPKETWAQMQNPVYGGPPGWKGTHDLMDWAVTMFPNTGGGTLSEGATGAYNQYFLGMAQSLVDNGQGDAVIRLGWEMNGDWFSWSALKDPADYIAYWRQIVTTMRSVPGASFRFLWAPGDGGSSVDPSEFYPGDAYVDLVGMSVYDESESYAPSQQVQRWAEVYWGLMGNYGLHWLAGFAAAHGKQMGFGEWGVATMCNGSGGGDDPYFIRQMYNYFATNDVVFESYFNVDISSCEHHALTDGDFPLAAAEYRKLFSQPFTPVVQPTTTGRPATAADLVQVSTNNDRSVPMALDGADLEDGVFVFAAPPASTKYVAFYLDGASSPTHIASSAPWDFAGAQGDYGVVYDASRLAAGTHSLRAVVISSTGSTTTTVQFSAGQPPAPVSSSPAPTTSAPVAAPTTSAPVAVPTTSAPVAVPTTSAPVAAPTTSAPVPAPTTSAPVAAPTVGAARGPLKMIGVRAPAAAAPELPAAAAAAAAQVPAAGEGAIAPLRGSLLAAAGTAPAAAGRGSSAGSATPATGDLTLGSILGLPMSGARPTAPSWLQLLLALIARI